MQASKRQELLRVLDDLKRTERLIRSAIADLDRLTDDAQAMATAGIGALEEGSAPYESGPAVEAALLPEADQFLNWRLSQAVLHLLKNAPQGNAGIIAALAAGGFRGESKNMTVSVAQCLKRLEGQGRVRRLSRGLWTHAATG